MALAVRPSSQAAQRSPIPTRSISIQAPLDLLATSLVLELSISNSGTILQSGSANQSIANSLVVLPGSSSLDTQANNVDATGVISGSGTLNKIGSGTLTLSGTASNTFSGGFNVNGGTVAATTNQQLGTGNVVTNNSSFLTIAGSTTQTVASVTNNAGSTITNFRHFEFNRPNRKPRHTLEPCLGLNNRRYK